MSFLTSFPGETNLMDVLMVDGVRAAPLLGYVHQVMLGLSVFSPAEREIIFAFVSCRNACSYCFGQHSHAARLLGVDDGLIDALVSDVQTAPGDDKFKLILAYVTKLTRAPGTVVASDGEGMAAAG
jgi:AhpD family alkylhydroperoxidase